MCSIAGIVDFEGNAALCRESEELRRSMVHRGPDQSGVFAAALNGDDADGDRPANVLLLHNRLCVIDIDGGRQPMTVACGERRYTVVYNGELYNTDELRNGLKNLGHVFDSRSDTEVVLRSYIEWGEECVNRMNGIFAFAVYDGAARRLFIARDRMGVKPFFYTLTGSAFCFASELKGLLACPGVQPRADVSSIRELIMTGPGRTPGCGVFKDFFELPPAYCGFFDDQGLRLRRYWKLMPREHRESFEETAEHVRYLVTDAIERQLVSDVPIGTFLSGGLDSSIICSIASRKLGSEGKRLCAFSVDYRDSTKYFKKSKFQPTSDTQFIPFLRDWLGCEHYLTTIDTAELVNALFDAVRARDLPGMSDVDSSLLLFCREIKKHVTVALSGECADEIFGGYPWYRDPEIREREGFPWAQSTSMRAKFLRPEYSEGFDPAEYVHERYARTVADACVLDTDSPTERRMKQMMRLNTDWFMQTLLDRKDRMSMFSALEVRVPFCDHRIAEYLYSVPWEFKEHGGFEKGLLRTAMTGLLPDEILWRRKSPYPKTHNPEYLETVSALLKNVLDDVSAPIHSVVRREALVSLLTDSNQQPWYGQLMTVPQTIAYMLQLNYWLDHYHVQLV